MSDKPFSCNQPLAEDEVRTLHVGQPVNPCDHTNYGPGSHNANPDFDVLGLFKDASAGTVKIQTDYTAVNRKTHKLETKHDTGTGFIVFAPSGDKQVISAEHVVQPTGARSVSITATDANGHDYNLSVYKKDHANDIASLDIVSPSRDLPETLHTGGEVRPGDRVAAVGYAGGHDIHVSPGAVVGMEPDARYGQDIKAKIHVHGGNSGSALVNADHQAVGVVVSKVNNSHANVIPIDKVRPLLRTD